MSEFETVLGEDPQPEDFGPDDYAHTDPATLPPDVCRKLLLMRDAFAEGNDSEAYHQLYSIADPKFISLTPWVAIETRATEAVGAAPTSEGT